MDAIPCRWLLLALGILGCACRISTDSTTLVPDPIVSAQTSSMQSAPSPAVSTMTSRAPALPVGGAMENPSVAAVSGNMAGNGNPGRPPAMAAAAGRAGSSGDGGAAAPAQAGMGGRGAPVGMPSDMVPEQTAGATDTDCDFNGVWLAKQLTVSEALGLPQTSNSWFYMELQQKGDEVVVTKSLDCGVEVRGTATVTLSRNTLEAALLLNSQVGRKATLVKRDGKCAFETARFWKVRGADEPRFLPNATRDSLESIAAIAMAKPLPTSSMSDGAVDTEGDGKLGMAFQVTGVIAGVRNSVQREWSIWFTEPGFEITPSEDWASDLTIRADFDNEESIIDPTSGLLASTAVPSRAKHQLKLRFLGRSPTDPRAAAFAKNDVDTCYAIQDAMKAETLE